MNQGNEEPTRNRPDAHAPSGRASRGVLLRTKAYRAGRLEMRRVRCLLLCLPLTRRFALLPALLLIPALRNRRTGSALTVLDHLLQGAGFLRELVRW